MKELLEHVLAERDKQESLVKRIFRMFRNVTLSQEELAQLNRLDDKALLKRFEQIMRQHEKRQTDKGEEFGISFAESKKEKDKAEQ